MIVGQHSPSNGRSAIHIKYFFRGPLTLANQLYLYHASASAMVISASPAADCRRTIGRYFFAAWGPANKVGFAEFRDGQVPPGSRLLLQFTNLSSPDYGRFSRDFLSSPLRRPVRLRYMGDSLFSCSFAAIHCVVRPNWAAA